MALLVQSGVSPNLLQYDYPEKDQKPRLSPLGPSPYPRLRRVISEAIDQQLLTGRDRRSLTSSNCRLFRLLLLLPNLKVADDRVL